MKNAIKVLVAIALFSSGFATGYFVRKRSEVTFEEVTEEELLEEASKGLSEAQEGPSSDILDEEPVSKPEGQEEAILSDSEGIGEGQKIAYFRKWKAEESLDKYSTFTSVEPDDVVSDVEDLPDSEFLQSIDEDIRNGVVRPEIEPGTIEDWNYWLALPDGEYDAIEVHWYEHDNVICDDQDNELENAERFVGFDIRKQFERISPDTTDDPDVRILINHRYRVVYYVQRIFGSWKNKKQMEEFGGDVQDDEEDEDIYNRFHGLRN